MKNRNKGREDRPAVTQGQGSYRPAHPVTGPAYQPGFKLLATLIVVAIAGYAAHLALRQPALQIGDGVKLLLLGAVLMLGISYYWFMRSTVSIDEQGIRQTWMYKRQVEWSEVLAARMIGIPYAGWLFPPRLIVRTGAAVSTFNGGSREVLAEFARISLAYRAKS